MISNGDTELRQYSSLTWPANHFWMSHGRTAKGRGVSGSMSSSFRLQNLTQPNIGSFARSEMVRGAFAFRLWKAVPVINNGHFLQWMKNENFIVFVHADNECATLRQCGRKAKISVISMSIPTNHVLFILISWIIIIKWVCSCDLRSTRARCYYIIILHYIYWMTQAISSDYLRLQQFVLIVMRPTSSTLCCHVINSKNLKRRRYWKQKKCVLNRFYDNHNNVRLRCACAETHASSSTRRLPRKRKIARH